jgi:hypothetical protein
MTNDSEKLASLLAYVHADARVCPQPPRWKDLSEMLAAKERAGGGWKPGLPLILGAWWQTSAIEKQLRLREHIDYAATHGLLDSADSLLRGLTPEEWHTLEEA